MTIDIFVPVVTFTASDFETKIHNLLNGPDLSVDVSVSTQSHLKKVFNAKEFSGNNGNKSIAAVLLCFAAVKCCYPDADTRLFGCEDEHSYPSLRSLLKVTAKWIRERIDVSLIGDDPGHSIRRNLLSSNTKYDLTYRGSFRDPNLRTVFLELVDAIETKSPQEVLVGVLTGYVTLESSRRCREKVSITSTVSGATVKDFVKKFLNQNRSTRCETIIWAVAKAADPNIWAKNSVNGNDKNDRVGDATGDDYAIESKASYLSLEDVEGTCEKARASEQRKRITMIVGQDRVFASHETELFITGRIKENYPDIRVTYKTLDEYMDLLVAGEIGRTTWHKVLMKINEAVGEMMPYDANSWYELTKEVLLHLDCVENVEEIQPVDDIFASH